MALSHKTVTSYVAKMEWLRADEIETDSKLQRPLDMAWVKRLADALDPDALGKPLVVAFPRTGRERFVVIDGQHRVRAVQMALGERQMVECEVVRGLTYSQAACLFRLRNSIRRPSGLSDFLVGVTAGDPECVAINKVVEGFGIRVAAGLSNAISAVGALRAVYRGDGAKGNGKNELALKRAIGTAVQAWGREGDALNGAILHGLGLLILRYGEEIDFAVLERRLAQHTGGAMGVLGAARGQRATMGGSLPQCVAAHLVREYNKGARKKKLTEWHRTAA